MDDKSLFRHQPRPVFQFSLSDMALVVLLISIVLGYFNSSISSIPLQTGRKLDIAIFGRGYLQVMDEESAGVSYTRNGRLSVDSDGLLSVNSGTDSWAIEPAICIPEDWISISFGKNGRVTVTCASGERDMVVGRITLAKFANDDGLQKVVPGIYAETVASGIATATNPGSGGTGFLKQGWLEKSSGLPSFSTIAPVGIVVIVAIYLLVEFRKLRRQFEKILARLPE